MARNKFRSQLGSKPAFFTPGARIDFSVPLPSRGCHKLYLQRECFLIYNRLLILKFKICNRKICDTEKCNLLPVCQTLIH